MDGHIMDTKDVLICLQESSMVDGVHYTEESFGTSVRNLLHEV
jgi:hypothetical protein